MLPKITHYEMPDYIDLCVNDKENFLVVSAPGIGKTVGTKAYAKAKDMDLILSHPAVEDPTDVKGYPAKTTRTAPEEDTDDLEAILNGPSIYIKDIATFLPFDQMLRVMEARKPTIWCLDDFGQAPASVQAAYMQFLGSRELAGKKIPDCVHIVACTNGREHKANVKGFLEPVKSRFGLIMELVADMDSFTEYYLNLGLPHEIIDYIGYTPNALHDFKANNGMENSPCPRLWEKLGKFLLSIPDKRSKMAEKVCCGCIGEEYGALLAAFLKIYAKLPAYNDIVAEPDDYPLDQKLDVRYAMLGMLANKAKAEHSNQIFTFIRRLAKEYQIAFMRTLSATKSPLIKSADAMSWSAENVGAYMAAQQRSETAF